ncbi:hypothetical protein [Myxococcus stipitatus]|uniref:hypothetical protein n=1 Tax=Myxococcus stipitatus TaxID=83455 RepID=UPI0030CB1711
MIALDARTRAVTGSLSLGPGSFGRTGLDVSASGLVDLTVVNHRAVGRGRLARTSEGRLEVSERQWRDRRGRDVDWPLESQCAWAPEEGGYSVECRIPNGVIFFIPAAPGPSVFSVWVSDADQPGMQKTLMGSLLSEKIVTEMPPTLGESLAIEQYQDARLP